IPGGTRGMKNNTAIHLRREHVVPYLEGCNALQYYHSNGDVYFGEVCEITPDYRTTTDIVGKLTVKFTWCVRLRDTSVPTSVSNADTWEPIPKTKVCDYILTFEDPRLEKIRSPLTFSSNGDRVEITHITVLARRLLLIKPKLHLASS
ncbi:MAG: hypothetical protein KGI59_03420, partial [Patescibacteria group bacterium]|nr:hypothetical protein [Patescibacteria group bacterium]